jgi:trans-aconitate methyltransferase
MQTMISWMERWDAVLDGHFPGREQEFELVLTVIERLVGTPKTLVDLACGPGSLALRAARRFPQAEILGVDLDPVLLEIARGAAGSERVRFVDGDLLDPGWSEPLGEVDVICATAALHYLDLAELPRLAGILADGVRVDGVVLIADTFRIGSRRSVRTWATSCSPRSVENPGQPGAICPGSGVRRGRGSAEVRAYDGWRELTVMGYRPRSHRLRQW